MKSSENATSTTRSRYYHIGHEPDLPSALEEARELYPPGIRPDVDEDRELWHQAEEAAADREADRLTSDPDWMG